MDTKGAAGEKEASEPRVGPKMYGCGMNTFFQLGLDIEGSRTGGDEQSSGRGSSDGGKEEDSRGVPMSLRSPVPLNVSSYIEAGDGEVEDMACGATFTLALTTNGTPYQWGMLNGRVYPTPHRLTWGIPLRCVQLACGRKHVMALMEGGFVMSWGVGYFGQLGHGDDLSYDRPRMIHHLDPQRIGDQVVSVACGGLHSAVSTAGQLVFCFGFNRYGQCGQGNCSNKLSTPRPVNVNIIGSARISQVVCGRHHTVFLTDQGTVYCWGATSFGRLGLPEPKKVVATPTEVTFFRSTPVHSIASGDFHMLALAMDWTVYAWGYGAEGQCGLGTTLHLRTPRPVEALRGVAVAQIACGAWWSMAITLDGDMYCWGYGDGGWLGLPIEHGLPFVEPGPPTEKYGPTCSFDSDFNMLLPERVAALEGFKVQRVYGGGGHTVVLGVPRTEEERRAAKEQYQGGDLRGLGGGLAVGEPKDEDDSRYAQYKESLRASGGCKVPELNVEYRDQVFSWARHNRLEEVQRAVDQGFPLDTVDDNGNTLLHVAAQNGLLKLCRLCIREGAQLNAANAKGDTPMHLSSRFGYKEVVRLLLDKGGDPTLQNEAGLTCLDGNEV